MKTVSKLSFKLKKVNAEKDNLNRQLGDMKADFNKAKQQIDKLAKLLCICTWLYTIEKKQLSNKIQRYEHERVGLIRRAKNAEKILKSTSRKCRLEKEALEDHIRRIRIELKDQEKRAQGNLDEKIGIIEALEKSSASSKQQIKRLKLENLALKQAVGDLEQRLKSKKSTETELERKHLRQMKELRFCLEDADEKEKDAVGKLNWVLHRLRASEARRLEMENGFGRAFVPSNHVRQLVETAQTIKEYNDGDRARQKKNISWVSRHCHQIQPYLPQQKNGYRLF